MNELVKLLIDSGNFHLGGSRRMNQKYPDKIKINSDTDYDLYCADTESNRNLINLYGFIKVDLVNRNYCDNLLVDMFKHPNYDIDVLIRSDVNLYKRVFESIEPDTFIYKLWKSSPKRDHDIPKSLFSAMVCSYFNCAFNDMYIAEKEFY